MQVACSVLTWVVVLGLAAAPGAASVMTGSEDSVAETGLPDAAGLPAWAFDGTGLLTQPCLWLLEDGPAGGLDADSAVCFDTDEDGRPDVARVVFSGPGFGPDLVLVLQDDPQGTAAGDLAEIIRATHWGGGTPDVNVLRFVDFDLSDALDTLVITGRNSDRWPSVRPLAV